MTAGLTLHVDDWEGVRSNTRVEVDPTWVDVEEAIRQLDGRRRTQVLLQRSDTSSVIVGGGNDGRYQVAFQTSSGESFSLLSADDPRGEVALVTGGQLGYFPARIVVGIEGALQATRTFFTRGVADEALSWEESEGQG